MRVNFDKWLPDLLPAERPAGSLADIRNLVPRLNYWIPFNNLQDYSTGTVAGTPLAGVLMADSGGGVKTFIGTTTQLYRYNADRTITNVSKSGVVNYAASQWSFAQYGDWVIANCYTYNPQILKGFTASNFVDLGGSPPKAKYTLLYHAMLMLLHTNTSGAIDPKGVRWSNTEDIENFSTGTSDTQTLADADGSIVGAVVAADQVFIFHQNSITVGHYSGFPYFLSFRQNAIRNVNPIENTMISLGNSAMFWARDNIYSFDGNSLQPMGTGVWNTIFADFAINYASSIQTAYDSRMGLVFWAYPSVASTGPCDKLLVYDTQSGRFGRVNIATYGLFKVASGYSGDLEAMAGDYSDTDTITIPFDSNFWLTSDQVLSTINLSNGKVAVFGGSALESFIKTDEFHEEGAVLKVQNVMPIVESPTGTISAVIASKFKRSDTLSVTDDYRAVNQWGKINLKRTGKWFSLYMKITGNHGGVSGAELEVVKVGGR